MKILCQEFKESFAKKSMKSVKNSVH